MTFQFIDDHRDEFPIRRMCEVLGVSRSGYYAWRQRRPSQREMANQALGDKIEEEYEKSHKTYGSPRIFRALQRQGVACSENRVARLMRQRDLQAQQTRVYKRTTRRNAADPVAPNLLLRDFTTARPNEVWLSDITYIRTQAGWLYLAATMDLYSRRIIGWAMANRQTQELALRAVRMALGQRQVPPGLIHHSDQGSQYTSSDYQQLLQDWGLQVSMNGVGTWYDNAPMESFFGTLKSEWAHHHVYLTRQEARTDLYYYIEAFYNRQRLHSALDYVSPVTYEAQYHQNLALVPG